MTFDEMVAAGRAILARKPPAPRVDPQTAGQIAADLHASEFALAHGGITYREPFPRPTTGDPLQDEINEMEIRVNRAQSEVFQMEEAGGIRGLKFARQNAKKAVDRARIDLLLADVLPDYEKKVAELAALREAHRRAMARRSPEKNPYFCTPQSQL